MADKKRKIVFRADGGSSIGMGHITRLLAMSDMLDDKYCKVFATRNKEKNTLKELKGMCMEIIPLRQDDKHFDEFLDYLEGDEIVVLDNYFFSADYQRKIKNKGCPLICIDDTYNNHYMADIVINHTPGVVAEKFSREDYTSLFLGLDYALLRRTFLDAATSAYSKPKGDRILLCFGGADPCDLTTYYTGMLAKIVNNREIDVVTGPAYRGHSEAWNAFFGSHKIATHNSVSPDIMASLLSKSRVALIPSSTLAFEALCFNANIITGFYTGNQELIYKGVKNYANVFGLGDMKKVTGPDLEKVLNKALVTVPVNRQLIDGKSGRRISDIVSSL
jgi:UDP-2,4-diacetamido-2,4,6-trideoxy-beta-L-altropyranose hydrolase